jgi:hypothetical protein
VREREKTGEGERAYPAHPPLLLLREPDEEGSRGSLDLGWVGVESVRGHVEILSDTLLVLWSYHSLILHWLVCFKSNVICHMLWI